VWKFWAELQARYPSNLEFSHSYGLGVLQLIDAPDHRRLGWLQSDSSEKQQLINYFTSLGSWHVERYELNAKLHESVAERDLQIAKLNAEIERIKSTVSWQITKPIRLIWNTLVR